VRELRFAQHHAGEERPQREGHAEQLRRAERDPHREGHHRQREEFARAGLRHPPQQARQELAPDDQHQREERADLQQGDPEREPHVARGRRTTRAERARDRRQQHEHQHHREVFDDQPADGDPAVHRFEHAACFQRAEQHHGARHRQGEAEHDRRAPRPSPLHREERAHRRGREDLQHRAGQGDLAHGKQIVEREMQADAEHQEHHADFDELGGQARVRDEARREGPDQHARDEIADQGGQPQPDGDEAQEERRAERRGERRDQGQAMRHRHLRIVSVQPPSYTRPCDFLQAAERAVPFTRFLRTHSAPRPLTVRIHTTTAKVARMTLHRHALLASAIGLALVAGMATPPAFARQPDAQQAEHGKHDKQKGQKDEGQKNHAQKNQAQDHGNGKATQQQADHRDDARREAQQRQAQQREAAAQQRAAAQHQAQQRELAHRQAEQRDAARRDAQQRDAARREVERQHDRNALAAVPTVRPSSRAMEVRQREEAHERNAQRDAARRADLARRDDARRVSEAERARRIDLQRQREAEYRRYIDARNAAEAQRIAALRNERRAQQYAYQQWYWRQQQAMQARWT